MKNRTKLQEKKSFASRLLVWGLTCVISIIYILIGHSIVTMDLDIFNMEDAYAEKAVVTEIGQLETDRYEMTEGASALENNTQYFYAKITHGEHRGQTVLAAQTSDNYTISVNEDPVSLGDKVILYNYGTLQGDAEWVFGGYARLDGIIFLGIVFCLLIILFGQLKGLNTLVSLLFTCLAVFAVFVPAVLNGFNVYTQTFITCVYTIVMTLLITNGATVKSFTTILGCSFGVLMAAIFSRIFDHVLRLTGMLDEHSIYLSYLESGKTLDLNALIFAMIVIGAMGAVMDVAMDISSSLYEVHIQAEHLKFKELFMSGIRIGRDIMGTMANTLVLAYIGSNLCGILLMITYSSSLYELLNRENIIVEMLNALVGSMAILLTIPLTSLVCAFMYTQRSALLRSSSNSKVVIDTSKFTEWKAEAEEPEPAEEKAPVEKEYKRIIPDDPVLLFFDSEKKTSENKTEEK